MKFVKHIRFTSIGDFENAKAMLLTLLTFFLMSFIFCSQNKYINKQLKTQNTLKTQKH